jgi:hypothetical protein
MNQKTKKKEKYLKGSSEKTIYVLNKDVEENIRRG